MKINKGTEFNQGNETICNICQKSLIKGERFFRVDYEEVKYPKIWFAGLRTIPIWLNCRVCLNCIKKIEEVLE